MSQFYLGSSFYNHVLEGLEGLQRQSRRSTQARIGAARRLAELEAGLGRVALLARALAELGLEQGWLRAADLERKLKEVDLADGARDDALDPRVVLPGESKLADLEPVYPRRKRKAPARKRRK